MATLENDRTNTTMMGRPPNDQDSSGTTETVEVGVIVIGFCCICLVACALVILQLRSNNRRNSSSRRQRGTENAGEASQDRTRGALDAEAPPSYDAVIRSPHLYPPSRRTSLTLDVSETRRSSASSLCSLSVNSVHVNSHRRESSENNRAQHSNIQPRRSSVGETEDPPPPYPGIITLVTPRNALRVESICCVHAQFPVEGSGHEIPGRVNAQNLSTSERTTERSSSPERHGNTPVRTFVVDAWAESNGTSRTPNCQSGCDMRNSVVNPSEDNAIGMVTLQPEDDNTTRDLVASSGNLQRENTPSQLETI